ncbi:MAG: ATP phosphoribosyltransferase [Micrococcales bacterium]|nr:ATP phosphoribosyltransferase [Micrococcales bacterium]
MLSLVLPKGSLEEQTYKLFADADLTLRKPDRGYNPTIDDPRVDRVKILRPQEIPLYVASGDFDLGISGFDWVTESGADVVEIAELPYAKTGAGTVKMVIAVSDTSDIHTVSQIRPGSRVTTEFPNITRSFFEKAGIPVEICFSYGATEAKVPDFMDALVDLTETGSTLRRNGLRIIDTILVSTTRLFTNRTAWEDPEKREAIEDIRTLLLGAFEARGRVLLLMNTSAECLDQVVAELDEEGLDPAVLIRSRDIFESLVLGAEFRPFLTLPAYELLD